MYFIEVSKFTCNDLCNTIHWSTFDPFFKIFTNVGVTKDALDYFVLTIIYTIVPYSVFLPFNFNSYFKEIIIKNTPINYDKMIEFYEKEILFYYCSEKCKPNRQTKEITSPFCVPNDIMQDIDKKWEGEKKKKESHA